VTISEGKPCGFRGRYAAGSFQGTVGPGGTAWEVKRVQKVPPTLSKKSPQGAVALLEGKNPPEMLRSTGKQWFLGDMSQQDCPVWEAPLYIISSKEPKKWPSPEQVLPEGWALSTEHRRADVVHGIGEDSSLKSQPECNYSLASLPPLEWQTYDVEYRVEKKDGKHVGHPQVTIYHNGVKIHDRFTLPQGVHKGRLQFQDHGNPVRYRNIWILPVEEK
jgi:hypothetical protein